MHRVQQQTCFTNILWHRLSWCAQWDKACTTIFDTREAFQLPWAHSQQKHSVAKVYQKDYTQGPAWNQDYKVTVSSCTHSIDITLSSFIIILSTSYFCRAPNYNCIKINCTNYNCTMAKLSTGRQEMVAPLMRFIALRFLVKSYVGQTQRCVFNRILDHNASLSGQPCSNLPSKCRNCDCTPLFANTKVLARKG